MRQSQLFTRTQRENPKDEEAKNAQLLIRGGYIYKEMFYKGCWTNLRKDLSNYPEVADKMQYLQSFLSDIKPSKSFDWDNNKIEGTDDFDHDTWVQYVKTTMEAIKTAIGELEPFDLSQDF